MTTASIHIVRQYGCVGGMERYVWELTKALTECGQRVAVVCEQQHGEAPDGVEVYPLGRINPKPGWLALWRFSRQVDRFFAGFDRTGWVLHSHERCGLHQVTTFHGPPIRERKRSWLDILSLRLQVREYLERRELCAASVRCILPNSLRIAEQLGRYYPQAAARIGAPAYPGVAPVFATLERRGNGKAIGFIGREWQRKGLPFARDLVAKLRQADPEVTLLVAGPEPAEIRHLFRDWPAESYRLLGWCRAEQVLPQCDLLIHPARVEPFGMVMAEANAAAVPVVISERCGIAPLITAAMGAVLPLDSDDDWLRACRQWLDNPPPVAGLDLTWRALAQQHRQLYQQLSEESSV